MYKYIFIHIKGENDRILQILGNYSYKNVVLRKLF